MLKGRSLRGAGLGLGMTDEAAKSGNKKPKAATPNRGALRDGCKFHKGPGPDQCVNCIELQIGKELPSREKRRKQRVLRGERTPAPTIDSSVSVRKSIKSVLYDLSSTQAIEAHRRSVRPFNMGWWPSRSPLACTQ